MYVSLKQLYQLVSVSTKREIAPGSPARTKRSERERDMEREKGEREMEGRMELDWVFAHFG